MTRERWMALGGYAGFFWIWFFLFCYWTFPYERVAAFISDKVRESGTGYTMEIGELSPHWITGVELNDVVVRKQPSAGEVAVAPAPGDKAKPADDGLKIQEAHARVGLFSLLFGGRSLSFDADLEQGEIEGSYDEDGEQKHLDATLSEIDIAKLGVLESIISLPAKGTLEGDFDLILGKEPTKSSGAVKLIIKDLTLGDGEAKLKVGAMGGLTIDPVNAGDVTMELDVKDGVGQVRKLNADGSDVVLDGSGEVRFADPVSRSRLDVLMRIKFTDAYKNKSSRTKAMFSLLDGASVPQVRAAKTPDGSLAYRLSGALSSVRAIPAGRTADKVSGGPSRRAGVPATPIPPPDPSADDEDEE